MTGGFDGTSDTPRKFNVHASKSRYARSETPDGLGLPKATVAGTTQLAGSHYTGATPAAVTNFVSVSTFPDKNGAISAISLHQPPVLKPAGYLLGTRDASDRFLANHLNAGEGPAINADGRNNGQGIALYWNLVALNTMTGPGVNLLSGITSNTEATDLALPHEVICPELSLEPFSRFRRRVVCERA